MVLFQVEANLYWKSHYRFDVPAAKNEFKKLGKQSIHVLLINAVVPLLFNYGKKVGNEQMVERAIAFLQGIPTEQNAIIKKWAERGIKSRSAYDSQALLELKNSQCANKKCLTCTIGSSIIKTRKND